MKRKDTEETEMVYSESIFSFSYRLERTVPFQSSDEVMLSQLKLGKSK